MTTTFPASAQPVATKFLAAGTMVRIRHNDGLFKIVTPAAWADSGHTAPTHYDVTGPNGRLHRMVPVERITVYSRALPLAFATYMADPDVRIDPVDRMMAKPAATMAMARRLLSPRFVESHSLLEIAAILAPRYCETHCTAAPRRSTTLSIPHARLAKASSANAAAAAATGHFPLHPPPPETSKYLTTIEASRRWSA